MKVAAATAKADSMAARPVPEKTGSQRERCKGKREEQGVRVRVCGVHYIDGGGERWL